MRNLHGRLCGAFLLSLLGTLACLLLSVDWTAAAFATVAFLIASLEAENGELLWQLNQRLLCWRDDLAMRRHRQRLAGGGAFPSPLEVPTFIRKRREREEEGKK